MESQTSDAPGLGRAIGAALAITLGVGVWLRWVLAGQLTLPFSFAYLRHAHSHMGYYGVLFPMAWLGWRACGAPIPSTRTLFVYAGACVLAFVGFVHAGYGAMAIAGSTVVAMIWLASSWRLRRRLTTADDPLALMLPGVILSLANIPPIAIFLRRDPPLAAAALGI